MNDTVLPIAANMTPFGGKVPASPFLAVHEMSFSYGGTAIFEDLSFDLGSSLTSLQGPSGCGKTTLLKLLNGDLTPSTGFVDRNFKSSVLILQEDALLPWLSGDDNLALSASFSYSKIHNSRIVDGIRDYSGRLAHTLSFGQRRYIELVRALGSDAAILFFDEPLNFLDRSKRQAIIDEMILQSGSRPIITTTHYIEDFDGAPVRRMALLGDFPSRAIEEVVP
jgi:NitT/TauT family transport system ATP-binding protein